MGAKVISKIVLCSMLMLGLVVEASTFAAEQTVSTSVQIKEFAFLDKELDRISLNTAAKPDGTRDGHLRLLLDAGDGVEITSITMKTADQQGKDTNHGVWKTWKAGAGEIGHLLAIVQDGKILNASFQATLGTFKGVSELELYASDNNGMKPGEFYYLEIATNKGIVKSGITPFAENETSYAPVVIREWSWQDLNSDRVGIAAFEADGRQDGHFKLQLNFAQKTEVLAFILRTTDKDGKDGYHGVWRTNRAGVGWLLGIMQGEKVLQSGFHSDVKEPVGSFRGNVTLDLYANNNQNIKHGEYFVIEVETTYGTVISKPVKFGDPASNYVNESPLGFKSIALQLNSNEASVDDQHVTLEVAPFTFEGRTMVPIRFIGEALGAKVDWNAKDRRVTLVKEDISIELTIDEQDAYVNGALTRLDAPAMIRDDITFVPVRYVSESMKMKVFFDNGEIWITNAKEAAIK